MIVDEISPMGRLIHEEITVTSTHQHHNADQLLLKQEQLYHRAIALELSLKDAYRQRELSKKAYEIRSKAIRKTVEDLGHTRAFLENINQGHQHSEFGLPNLQECSPEELTVVGFFLGQRRELLRGLTRESQDIFKWLQGVTLGKSGWLKSILRLSKLRKKLFKIERSRILQQQQEEAADQTVKMFMNSQPNRHRKSQVNTTLEGLMAVFGELNHLASRVAKLQHSVTKEQTIVTRMEQWLALKQQDLSKLSPLPPPSPDAMYEAEIKAYSIAQAPVQRTEDRLVLARRWAEQTNTQDGFDHEVSTRTADQLRQNSTMSSRRRGRTTRTKSRYV